MHPEPPESLRRPIVLSAELERLIEDAEATLERLHRQRDSSRPGEGAGGLGENRQIGMEPNAIQPPDAER
jgi:hypothetical protein